MAFDGEIFEVFSWLPAKSIVKFRSVCKVCDEFVSDRLFIKNQNRNLLSKGDTGFFIQPDSCQRYHDKFGFYVFPGEESSSGVPSESVEFMKNNGRLLASSNGLVCCRNLGDNAMNETLFICNPATRSWVAIPYPGCKSDMDNKDFHVFFECGVGLSYQHPHDYMLMVMEEEKDWSTWGGLLCKAYLPQEGIWLETGCMDAGSRNLFFEFPVYQNSTIYLLSDWFPYLSKNSMFFWPYIVAFDPCKGKSSFLQLPKNARKGLNDQSCKMGIFNWGMGKSICLVKLIKGVFIVWKLIDESLGSWSKILKVRARAMGMIEPNPTIAGFRVINGDSLLVATRKRV